jgi:hypothetical protein
MSRPLRFPIDPRLIPPSKVARRLGISEAVFEQKRPALTSAGFPEPDPLLGNYSLEAVDKWIDHLAGLTRHGEAVSDPSIIRERIRQRGWAR